MLEPSMSAAELGRRVWQELGRATVDRHHGWRTPALATVGPDGWPQARTVVLRRCEAATRTLWVYTDRRSPKVRALQARPQAQLLCWCPRLHWQLRLRATVEVLTDGPAWNEAWQRVGSTPAVRDYLSARPPGDALPEAEGEGSAWSDQPQLAVLALHCQHMDALSLSRDGHRRAAWSTDSGDWTALVP